MSGSIGILAVDDSLVVRSLLSRLIDAEPDLHLMSTASDGRRAVDKVSSIKPDVVVLDVEMPIMNGVEALVEIRKIDPDLPVIMFSNLTRTGAATTLEALANGAKDYAPKPQGSADANESFEQIRRELFPKIRQAHEIRQMKAKRRADWSGAARNMRVASEPETAPAQRRHESATVPNMASVPNIEIDAVVVGASTGGPVALETVLEAIARPLPVPMMVVQHMPPVFTKALADRLDRKVATRVVEAEAGMVVEAGTCYIAPGGQHLRVRRHSTGEIQIVTDTQPAINGCRPSVEPLFESAAQVYGKRLAAVIMTGVGRDGATGAALIAKNGSPVIVQDEESSVVWGMPGTVAQAGHATDILPIQRIGPAIAALKMSDKVGVS